MRVRSEGRQRATAGAHSLNRQRRVDAGDLARGRAHPRAHPRRQHGGLRSAPANLSRRQLQLERLGEVAAQLVEKQLESGDVALFKQAKTLVDKLLYAASEKLAATPGCESLRMLMSRIQRHDD